MVVISILKITRHPPLRYDPTYHFCQSDTPISIKGVIVVCINIALNFNDVNLQHVWIHVASWNEMVTCNPIVINHITTQWDVSMGSRRRSV